MTLLDSSLLMDTFKMRFTYYTWNASIRSPPSFLPPLKSLSLLGIVGSGHVETSKVVSIYFVLIFYYY